MCDESYKGSHEIQGGGAMSLSPLPSRPAAPWIEWHIRPDGWVWVRERENKDGPCLREYWKDNRKPLRGRTEAMDATLQWYADLMDPDHLEH